MCVSVIYMCIHLLVPYPNLIMGGGNYCCVSWAEIACYNPFLSRSTTGLNSTFSFYYTSYHNKVEEPVCHTIYL